MGYPQIWKPIRDYWLERIGEQHTVFEIAAALNLSDSQVQGGMQTLIRQGYDITVIIKAKMWKMNSSSMKNPKALSAKLDLPRVPEEHRLSLKLLGQPIKGRYVALNTDDDSVWWVQPIEE